jgi:lysophospholipase L1-like esterase
MILVVIINAIILSILIYVGFLFYRKNYLQYNLLRSDPLEESKIAGKLLNTSDSNVNIWLIGDSRIAHWNKNFFSPTHANIVNLGIDGQTSRQVLQRFKNHLEFGKPDWIILEVGINDLKVIGLNRKLSNKISVECYNNIISIIEICQADGINVICCNIFPNGKIEFTRKLVWNSLVDQEIIEINKKLKRYSERNNIEHFDAYRFLSEDSHRVKEDYQNGFLHLNDEAYLALTKQIINEFGNKINLKTDK